METVKRVYELYAHAITTKDNYKEYCKRDQIPNLKHLLDTTNRLN